MLKNTAIKLWDTNTRAFAGQGIHWALPRVPVPGELVVLGSDSDGLELVCKVLLTIHIPEGQGDVNAEVYGIRTNVEDELRAVWPP